jgi:hypothetical protein
VDTKLREKIAQHFAKHFVGLDPGHALLCSKKQNTIYEEIIKLAYLQQLLTVPTSEAYPSSITVDNIILSKNICHNVNNFKTTIDDI